MVNQHIGNHGLGIFWLVRFDLGPLLQGQMRIAKINSVYISLIVSPDSVRSRRRRRDFLLDARTFRFGMWVYMGNATNAIVL